MFEYSKINKTKLFVQSTDVGGLSRWQIIDTVKPMVGLYFGWTDLLENYKD